jgi:hypothetical protein
MHATALTLRIMGRSVGNRSARVEETPSLIVLIVHIVPNAANRKFLPKEGIVPARSSMNGRMGRITAADMPMEAYRNSNPE